MRIRVLGSEQPTRLSVEQELLKSHDVKAELPTDIKKMLAELEVLYTFPTANINYSLEEVRQWAIQHALIKAIDVSFGFIQSGKPEKVREAIQRALSVGDECHLERDDFFQTEPQLPQEIIPSVLRAESIGIMSSSSKSYKTWNLLAACIASGMGKSWMGFERCKPVRVLYVNLELHVEELKKRIDIVAAAMGTTRAALQGHVDFLNLKGQRNQIDRVLARIRSYGNANGPWRLIMIDPVYKLYSSDDTKDNSENSTSAIAAMFEKLEVLARELKAAIILVHNFRKGNQGSISDIDLGSGSGVFARAPVD
jgi:RecA-family ATPase